MSTHYLRSYGGETEVLRVSTLDLRARWLVPRLKGWRLRHPSIHLDLCNEQEADDLLQGRSDLAFYFGQGSRPGTECLKLFGEELVPVCAPGSLPDQPFTDPTQLTDLVLLQNASRPQAWHDWFDSQGYHTEHSYHGPRFETFICASARRRSAAAWRCCRGFWWKRIGRRQTGHSLAACDAQPDAYYLAYPEHSAEVPKVRDFVKWMLEQIDSPTTTISCRSFSSSFAGARSQPRILVTPKIAGNPHR
jgi:DNA-binding transcriptional LysR family regulator